jgi:hypothetical protein
MAPQTSPNAKYLSLTRCIPDSLYIGGIAEMEK